MSEMAYDTPGRLNASGFIGFELLGSAAGGGTGITYKEFSLQRNINDYDLLFIAGTASEGFFDMELYENRGSGYVTVVKGIRTLAAFLVKMSNQTWVGFTGSGSNPARAIDTSVIFTSNKFRIGLGPSNTSNPKYGTYAVEFYGLKRF